MPCCWMGTRGENWWQSKRWSLQKTQGLDSVGNGWKLKPCCSQGGISRPGSHFTSMIPVTSPWNPSTSTAPRQSCAPASAQAFQQKIYSHTERKGRFELRKSCFTLKAAKSWWHQTEKKVEEEEITSQHQLCCSPAISWRTFLTSNQGLKGVRLKGVWQEGI